MHRFGSIGCKLRWWMTDGRRKGSQNNFTDEFQAKQPADVTVWNESKMAAILGNLISEIIYWTPLVFCVKLGEKIDTFTIGTHAGENLPIGLIFWKLNSKSKKFK